MNPNESSEILQPPTTPVSEALVVAAPQISYICVPAILPAPHFHTRPPPREQLHKHQFK